MKCKTRMLEKVTPSSAVKSPLGDLGVSFLIPHSSFFIVLHREQCILNILRNWYLARQPTKVRCIGQGINHIKLAVFCRSQSFESPLHFNMTCSTQRYTTTGRRDRI